MSLILSFGVRDFSIIFNRQPPRYKHRHNLTLVCVGFEWLIFRYSENLYIVHPLRLYQETDVLYQSPLIPQSFYSHFDFGHVAQLSRDSSFLHFSGTFNSVKGLNIILYNINGGMVSILRDISNN